MLPSNRLLLSLSKSFCMDRPFETAVPHTSVLARSSDNAAFYLLSSRFSRRDQQSLSRQLHCLLVISSYSKWNQGSTVEPNDITLFHRLSSSRAVYLIVTSTICYFWTLSHSDGCHFIFCQVLRVKDSAPFSCITHDYSLVSLDAI